MFQFSTIASEMAQREGADITAADMVAPELDPSEIEKYFNGTTILITGVTGFLGKIFLEKILRACPDVKKVYVVVREKHGESAQTRYNAIFDAPIFDALKRKRFVFSSKVKLVIGDCLLPQWGLSQEDQNQLIKETNCVFHCAASDSHETLRNSGLVNVRGTTDLINLAKKMKDLQVFIYLSSAYTNIQARTVDETLCASPIIEPKKLFSVLETLDDEKIQKILPEFLGPYSNVSLLTKAIAESEVLAAGSIIPIGVLRPSNVIGSVKEPVSGWIEDGFGPSQVLLGAALGLVRSLRARKEISLDIVPADYVVNCGLAIAWDIGSKNISNNFAANHTKVEVFNYVSTPERDIKWDKFIALTLDNYKEVPSIKASCYPSFVLRPEKFAHLLATIFYHLLPAYFIDFFCYRVLGRETRAVESYKSFASLEKSIEHYTKRDWDFTNNNVQKLWAKLNVQDKESFEFNMKTVTWNVYACTYVRGMRVYLLKDDLETIAEGRVKIQKLRWAHYALNGLFWIVVLKVLSCLIKCIF